MTEDRFFMPAKVYFGKGAVAGHADDLARFGKKALIVTGRHSAKACGVYDDIVNALDKNGVEHAWFSEVEENPSTQTIMKARDMGLLEKADFVIGAGGGSPMDASKAIALMMKHPQEGIDYLYRSGADASTVPVVCIPTTCGTGSEVTAVSVLSSDVMQTKKSIPFKIFPDLSLIDGTYLKSASMQTLCNTAFDALAHLYESYINADASPISKLIAQSGISEWKKCLPVLLGERDAQDEDRDNLMRAAMLGGMAIAHTGTSLPHALSYSLTYRMGVPHGKAVTFFLAGYLNAADEKEVQHILHLAGFEDTEDFQDAYLKCCGVIGIDEGELLPLLKGSIEEIAANPEKCAKAPFEVNRQVIEKIVYFSI